MPRHGLHARSLAFTQPTTGKRLTFDSILAPDMQALVEKWRGYVATRGLEEE